MLRDRRKQQHLHIELVFLSAVERYNLVFCTTNLIATNSTTSNSSGLYDGPDHQRQLAINSATTAKLWHYINVESMLIIPRGFEKHFMNAILLQARGEPAVGYR